MSLSHVSKFSICLSVLSVLAVPAWSAYSISEIQYTTSPTGESPLDDPNSDVVIDCFGGVVTMKFEGSRPRVVLQDPNDATGWGGIQVKDWTGTLFGNVNVGDWVSVSNVLLQEYRGTTMLQYMGDYAPNYTVVSTGNPVPAPVVVDVSAVLAPVQDPNGWFVADHSAEIYESMRVRVQDVTVTGLDNGKARDDYTLESGDDPNASTWASDYMNADRPWDSDYHDYVEVAQYFGSVTGVFEQYTKLSSGWDYYQILTTCTGDFTGYPGDANLDGSIDIGDLGILGGNYGVASDAAWQEGDFTGEGAVGIGDLGVLGGSYGTNPGGAATAVPEPVSLAIMATAAVAMLRRRWR